MGYCPNRRGSDRFPNFYQNLPKPYKKRQNIKKDIGKIGFLSQLTVRGGGGLADSRLGQNPNSYRFFKMASRIRPWLWVFLCYMQGSDGDKWEKQ